MDLTEIIETDIWKLYEKGRDYFRMFNVYSETEKNYRFYNGNQWGKAKLGDVEPIQKNFIKPIVRYKNGVIHDNLYAVNYSSQNYENKEFRMEAENICDLLNKKASQIWENDKMDKKGRSVTKDAAINGEGIIYVDSKNGIPSNEIVKKVDVYYGNENDEDIQNQPYILIRKRMPVSEAQKIAEDEGLSTDEIKKIIGDKDNFEQSGEDSKFEVNDMTTIITKMYKKNGTVHFSQSSKYVVIKEDKDTGLTLYPIAHMTWEEKEGSARGEGEVNTLIPNQIEVNRTEVRRALTVKYQAYPQKIVNERKIINPSALTKVGGIIRINDTTVDDVKKAVSTLQPAQMSTDVKQLVDDLIQTSRDLAGAGDIATGSVNPESASGKAILAVQQASQSPMTEQKNAYKDFVEDLARIWLDILITYNPDGLELEEEVIDPQSQEKSVRIYSVLQETLKSLQATVKVDITPKGAFDKYAQELSIENMFKVGMFNVQKLQELKIYVELLDDDSVMNKQKLKKAIELMENEQRKIAMIDAQAQALKMQANSFLNSDIDSQASQLNDAKQLQPNQNNEK